jgi:hypothetical protein
VRVLGPVSCVPPGGPLVTRSGCYQVYLRCSRRSVQDQRDGVHIRLYHRDQPGRHDRLGRVMHRHADPDRRQHRREAHRRRNQYLGRDHSRRQDRLRRPRGPPLRHPSPDRHQQHRPAIKVGATPLAVAITRGGTTAYIVSDGSDSVTPINTAGKPIKVNLGVLFEKARQPARPAARQSMGRKSRIAANARPPARLCADLPSVTRPVNVRGHRWIRAAGGPDRPSVRTVPLVQPRRQRRELSMTTPADQRCQAAARPYGQGTAHGSRAAGLRPVHDCVRRFAGRATAARPGRPSRS